MLFVGGGGFEDVTTLPPENFNHTHMLSDTFLQNSEISFDVSGEPLSELNTRG